MRNRILFLSLAVVLAVSVGLVGCDGAQPSEFMIYEVNPVTVLLEDVQDLASTLFAQNITPPVNATDWIFWSQLDTLYLECCKNSGSIWFADFSKLYNEEYVPEDLPSREGAEVIAEEFLGFLTEQGLIPEQEVRLWGVSQTEMATFNITANKKETRINHMNVHYGFPSVANELNTTIMPGKKIRVSIGDNGEIIGFHYIHPDLRDFEPYQAITEEEALQILVQKLGGEPETLEVRREYYFGPEFIIQGFAQPYYIFDGTVMIGEEEVQFKTQLIPATTFSPIVRIVSPDNGAEFPEGRTIDFEASVSGGEPPYEYVWESDIDGVIGTGASLSSSNLSVGQRDEEILPNTIKLKVTDQNGNQDIDLISIKFIPNQPALFHAMESTPEGIQTLSTGSPNDDDNDMEVGIEWVNAYAVDPLGCCDENARGFRDELATDGWVPQFDWGDHLAWEQDFKFRGGLGGGRDFDHIDAVDFAYFSGHGSLGNIKFCSFVDEAWFDVERARWGGNAGGISEEEGDLEWIVVDACYTLGSSLDGPDIFERWDQAFDGLHYVLGFSSECGDSPNRGTIFAQYMKQGWPVRLAWIRATQATEGPHLTGAYLRAERLDPRTNTCYDHLPGHGYVSPDPYPVDYLVYCRWRC